MKPGINIPSVFIGLVMMDLIELREAKNVTYDFPSICDNSEPITLDMGDTMDLHINTRQNCQSCTISLLLQYLLFADTFAVVSFVSITREVVITPRTCHGVTQELSNSIYLNESHMNEYRFKSAGRRVSFSIIPDPLAIVTAHLLITPKRYRSTEGRDLTLPPPEDIPNRRMDFIHISAIILGVVCVIVIIITLVVYKYRHGRCTGQRPHERGTTTHPHSMTWATSPTEPRTSPTSVPLQDLPSYGECNEPPPSYEVVMQSIKNSTSVT